MKLQGRSKFSGIAQGEALVTSQAISFFGGIDPESGIIVERGHGLEGQCAAGKMLVFPIGKGSTVGSYSPYRLKHNGHALLAMLNAECEAFTTVGFILPEISFGDQIPTHEIPPGCLVQVEGGLVYFASPTQKLSNGAQA